MISESAPSPNQPLGVKWSHGKGTVYHLLTSHLVSMDEQGGSDFYGLSDILELPSKEIATNNVKNLEKLNPENPPLATMKSWKAALIAEFYSPINMAKSYALPIEFTIELLNASLQN